MHKTHKAHLYIYTLYTRYIYIHIYIYICIRCISWCVFSKCGLFVGRSCRLAFCAQRNIHTHNSHTCIELKHAMYYLVGGAWNNHQHLESECLPTRNFPFQMRTIWHRSSMFFLKTIVKPTSDVYGFNIINVLDLLQRALKQPPMPEEVPEEAIKQMVGYMISWHLVENLKTPTLLDIQVDKGKDIIWFWWFNKCNSKTARSVSGHWASKTKRLSWRKCACTQSPIKRNFTIWDVENPRHSKYEPICYQVFSLYLSLSFSFTKESPECSYQAVLVTRAPCQFLWRQSPISWPRSIKICDKAIAFRIRRDFSHSFVFKGDYCNGWF